MVRFASKTHIINNNANKQDVEDRPVHELWYTQPELTSMIAQTKAITKKVRDKERLYNDGFGESSCNPFWTRALQQTYQACAADNDDDTTTIVKPIVLMIPAVIQERIVGLEVSACVSGIIKDRQVRKQKLFGAVQAFQTQMYQPGEQKSNADHTDDCFQNEILRDLSRSQSLVSARYAHEISKPSLAAATAHIEGHSTHGSYRHSDEHFADAMCYKKIDDDSTIQKQYERDSTINGFLIGMRFCEFHSQNTEQTNKSSLSTLFTE